MAKEIKISLAVADGQVGKIQNQIDNIKGTAKVKLKVETDAIDGIKKSIESKLGKTKIPIKIKVDGTKTDITQSVQKKIGDVKIKIAADGKKSDVAASIAKGIGTVKVKIDVDGTKNDVASNLSKKIGTIKVGKIDASDAVGNVRKQLQDMLSALSIKNGVNITGLKEFIGADGVDGANKAIAASADKAVASMNREAESLNKLKANATSFKSSMKSLTQVSNTTKGSLSKAMKLMSAEEQTSALKRFQSLEDRKGLIEVGNVAEVHKLRDEYIALNAEILKNNEIRATAVAGWKTQTSVLKEQGKATDKAFRDASKYLAGTKELDEFTRRYSSLKKEQGEILSKQLGKGKDEENLNANVVAQQRYVSEINKAVAAKKAEEAATKAAATATKAAAKANQESLVSMMRMAKLSKEIQSTLSRNTKLKGTPYESELRSIMSEMDSGREMSPKTFEGYQSRYNNIIRDATAAGKMGRSFTATLKQTYDRLVSYGIITGVFYRVSSAVRDVYNNVVNLDSAMTQLRKVTDETDSTYEKFYSGVSDRAKNIGTTMADTINASADFARLGYDIDTASNMADAALVYKNVGDNITNIEDASQSLISTIQAFKDFGIEANDAMEVVDRFNEVGRNYCPAA